MSALTYDDPNTDGQTDDTAMSRRGWGKHLLLSASALAVLFAGNRPAEVEAAPATDTWKLGGNAGVDTTNFIGPTNSAPLIIKTAGVERMRITPTGNIGIGNTSPTAKLLVDVANGVAIYGRHLATSGDAPGVRGDSSATVQNATGVQGVIISTAPAVGSAGVRGVNSGKNGNGAGVYGTHAGSGYGVHGTSFSNTGVRGVGNIGVYGSGSTQGVYGDSVDGYGVYGFAKTGVYGIGRTTGVEGKGDTTGVLGSSTNGTGVEGSGQTGLKGVGTLYGVYGKGTEYGVYGVCNSGLGVIGSGKTGVRGTSPIANGVGVSGEAATGVAGKGTTYGVIGSGPTGVYGNGGTSGYGIVGDGRVGVTGGGSDYGTWGSASTTGIGAYGKGKYGVWGEAASAPDLSAVVGNGGQHAVLGQNGRTSGVLGKSDNIGVSGEGGVYGMYCVSTSTATTNNFAIYAKAGGSGNAAYFDGYSTLNGGARVQGHLSVTGDIYVTGEVHSISRMTKIDHPSDPTNRYLYHSSVESPDMKTIYDGIVTLDAKGENVVTMPQWFEALNMEFRYQLTCIGGYAPVYIADEIEGNRFRIAGGKAGMKVSWMVTGIRQDAYAKANRTPVEELKPARERGTYLHPEAFGKPASMGIATIDGQIEMPKVAPFQEYARPEGINLLKNETPTS